jgi:glycerol kinase
MTYVVAIDAGTTGVRSRAVFADGRETVSSYLEFTQYFPAPGLVEHDADEIWRVTHGTLVEVIERIGSLPAAIGITNQRETVVAWDRTTGDAFGRAIVWQDRRTSQRCVDLAPHLDLIRGVTGLVLDPYFSGTKIEWLLANGVPRTPSVAFGTVDSWLLWKLTGGAVFATDESNASRTLLWVSPSIRCPMSTIRAGGSARLRQKVFPREFPFPASRVISRLHSLVKRVSHRATQRTPTEPAASFS